MSLNPTSRPPLAGHAISRRGFLRAGIVTTAALASAGSVVGCLRAAPENAGDEHPEVLSRKDLGILAAFADRVVTAADGTPSAREARVARRIDRELAFNDGTLAGDVRAALTMIEYGPFLDFRLRPFTRLGAAEQDAFLEGCARSTWRLRRNAFSGLRFLCLFFYYSDDRTWRSIGYGGPMVGRKLPEAANAREALDQPLGSART